MENTESQEDREVKRESTEWLDVWLPHTNEDSLPRVLLIGNSITRGYHREVDRLLDGKLYVSRMSTSKSIGDPGLLKEIALVMSYHDFDAVHFNNGLHGWKYTEKEYNDSFLDMVNTIKNAAPHARLIWASTTPVYVRDSTILAERNDRVIARNLIAEQQLNRLDILENDLYTIGVNHTEYYAHRDGFHPSKEGLDAYAKQVAESILSSLNR